MRCLGVIQDREEVNIEGPSEYHVEYSEYLNVYGDPRTNGKGHTVKKVDGVWGVSIPGPNVRKIYGAKRTDMFQIVCLLMKLYDYIFLRAIPNVQENRRRQPGGCRGGW